MVIQSAFKDYYDFVANRYGGGDPKIVYVRKRIKEQYDANNGGQRLAVELPTWPFPYPDQLSNWYWEDRRRLEVAYLVAAARPYLLSREADNLERGLGGYTITDFSQMDKEKPRWRRLDFSFVGRESPVLIELSRAVGAPVFVVEGVDRQWRKDGMVVYVNERCPVLKRLGMARLTPPEQMYQDLAYFVGNTMKPVPDTEPPVAVSNREKILKAGFDLKQSFRHRI